MPHPHTHLPLHTLTCHIPTLPLYTLTCTPSHALLTCHIPTHTSLYTPSHAHPHMHILTCHTSLYTPSHAHPHMPHPHTPSHAHTSLFHIHVHTFTCVHLSFTHTHTHTHISPLHSQIAAQSLREVTDEFLEEGNPIITVAKKMSQQMFQMAEFTHGRGELQVWTFLSVCLLAVYLDVIV